MGVTEVAKLLLQLYLMTRASVRLESAIDCPEWRTYGSGYLFKPSRSNSRVPSSVPSLSVPLASLPALPRSRPGPYAFSLASRRIFVPSSL